MYASIFASFFDISHLVAAMCVSGIVLFLVGAWTTRNGVAQARGLDKIAVLSNLCFAIPLAVFGALHLFGVQFVVNLVPRYLPGRLSWAYFVGCALIAASLSIASKIGVRWSGLLFGIMMFLFVALIHFPGAVALRTNRIVWTIVFREMSFGGGGWLLAAGAANGWPEQVKKVLLIVGRILVAIAAIVFGVEHFLHPTGLPGVPLERQMPTWLAGRVLIDCVTGAALLVAGASILLNKKTRTITTLVGSWILLLVIVIYGPVLISALSETGVQARVEGINYFADTLLFAGTVLAVAKAAPRCD